MSTMDDMKEIRDILYKIGMLETMCFTLTDDVGYWYIDESHVYYSHWNSTGKCDAMIDYWRT